MKTTVDQEKQRLDLGNYYEDILPEDIDEANAGRQDNKLIIRLLVLGFFVLVTLSACVALLVLFSNGNL